MITQAPTRLIARTGHQIDRIRINTLERQSVEGVPVWVKRRTASSHWLVPVANAFFRLAGNPVRVFPTNRTWQAREAELFRLLNGNDHVAGALGAEAVYAEALPGRDLVDWIRQGHLTSDIMRRVGQAFLEMHRTADRHNGQLFSHGDPHLGNVIFDSQTESVGWIDFETEHRSGLAEAERHADDLLVFLLDLVGRANEEQWKSWSPIFLDSYGRTEVLEILKKRLDLPNGLGAIWWAVRTSYMDRRELRERLNWLAETL